MEQFIDSSGFFAWIDKDSPQGNAIQSFISKERLPLVTTNLIFTETLSLITKRIGKHRGIDLGNLILQSKIIRLAYLDEAVQKEAWQLYKKYKDKDFDFIDATSFVFCQKHKIKNVITLDRHFVQMGFKVYPG